MILDKEIEVKWHNLTREHYESLGYSGYKFNTTFKVNVTDVSKGSSKVYINVKCDTCEKKKNIRFNAYISSINNCGINFGEWLCNVCISRRNRGKSKAQIEKEIYELHKEEYSLIGDYVNRRTKILIKHNSCDYEWEISPDNFLSLGHKCPKCSGKVRNKNKEYLQKEVDALYNGDILIVGEYSGNKNKIELLHKICGTKYLHRPNDFLNGHLGCPNCKISSRGEIAVKKVLDRYSLSYQIQYTLLNCKNKNPLPFDFAVFNTDGSLMTLIEYQGKQHYEPVNFGGISDNDAQKNLIYVQMNDEIKYNYCKKEQINLIRIPYWEFNKIEEIIKEEILNKTK